MALFSPTQVHIEQGPVLEAVEAPLGVVPAISGQTRLSVRKKNFDFLKTPSGLVLISLFSLFPGDH